MHAEADITIQQGQTTFRALLTWSWDLETLLRNRRLDVEGTTDDGRAIPVAMEQLGGFVSIVFDAVPKDVPLNPGLFAKHCRVKLLRLTSGRPFNQTFLWEDPTGPEFLTVRVRLHIVPLGIH